MKAACDDEACIPHFPNRIERLDDDAPRAAHRADQSEVHAPQDVVTAEQMNDGRRSVTKTTFNTDWIVRVTAMDGLRDEARFHAM